MMCTSMIAALLLTAAAPTPPDNEKVLRKLDAFSKALNYVEANYVKPVDAQELIDAAIDGMLSRLDPHTLYLPPNRYSKMKEGTSGQYGGLGLEVIVEERGIVVVTPLNNSPAAKAGIKSGDLILEIDGASAKGLSANQVQDKLQGKKGSKVKLVLQEKASGITRNVELIRDNIQIQSVTSKQFNDIAYIRLNTFQERTAHDVAALLNPMINRKEPIKGIILDLRNNPGGLLEEAIELADLFIDEGTIVSTKGRRTEYAETRKATKAGTLPHLPMITLINGGTASAPEIVAGALKDHRTSIILGTRSFGKGSVQTVIDLGDGSGLKLTVATYYTPNGDSIQARGIVPDIIVDPDQPDIFQVTSEEQLREEDLTQHLEVNKKSAKNEAMKLLEDDLQLKRAVDQLQAWIIFSKTPSTKP